MANRYFQQARDTVTEAVQLMYSSHTPEERVKATEKLTQAKRALSQAFADSSMAERQQLMTLQQTLYEFAEEFTPENLN